MLTRPDEARPAKKRALTLAGGGPAVGIGLGVLEALGEFPEITFDVLESLSCVGAWLGCLYQVSPDRAEARMRQGPDEKSLLPQRSGLRQFPCPPYSFPTFRNTSPPICGFWSTRSYTNLVVPGAIQQGYQDILNYYLRPANGATAILPT